MMQNNEFRRGKKMRAKICSVPSEKLSNTLQNNQWWGKRAFLAEIMNLKPVGDELKPVTGNPRLPSQIPPWTPLISSYRQMQYICLLAHCKPVSLLYA